MNLTRVFFVNLTILGFILVSAIAAKADLQTVPYVDLSRYAGTWYQIARNPLIFEGNCVCSRQVLTPAAEGRIDVYNSCNDYTVSGPIREIRGFATNDDPTTNAKFTVDFDLPHKGAYWIIALDNQYRYAVVSDPSMKSLYILSKTPELAPELYNAAINQVAYQIDTSKLQRTLQAGCVYP